MSSDKCLIGQMLNELSTTRTSIKRQNAAIAEVLEKSNNVLIQVEATKSLKSSANDNATPYTYNKETINALTKVVDKFIYLLSADNPAVESGNFEEYLDAARKKADYLGCNTRKLLAIWDTVQQMHAVLERQELEFNIDEDMDEEFY